MKYKMGDIIRYRAGVNVKGEPIVARGKICKIDHSYITVIVLDYNRHHFGWEDFYLSTRLGLKGDTKFYSVDDDLYLIVGLDKNEIVKRRLQ